MLGEKIYEKSSEDNCKCSGMDNTYTGAVSNDNGIFIGKKQRCCKSAGIYPHDS
jgi:hypothetical protein